MAPAEGLSAPRTTKGLVRRVAARHGAHLRHADVRAVGQEQGSNTKVSSSQPPTSGVPSGSGGARAGRGTGVSVGTPRCPSRPMGIRLRFSAVRCPTEMSSGSSPRLGGPSARSPTSTFEEATSIRRISRGSLTVVSWSSSMRLATTSPKHCSSYRLRLARNDACSLLQVQRRIRRLRRR